VAPGRRLLGIAALVGSAFAGAALALAGAVALDAFDEDDAAALPATTTVTIRSVADPVRGLALSGASITSELTINEIYERAKSGVVQINAGTAGLGSGFVLDKAGHIVTSFRVIEGQSRLTVSFSSRDGVPARVVGADPSTDVAVLEVEATSRALTALELGTSSALRVGDPVVAIGNPYGLDRSASAGIVGSLSAPQGAGAGAGLDYAIQTGAATSASAGGPLLDQRGRVIGVSTAAGFAVPIDTVRTVAAQLIAGRSVRRAHLGADVREVDSVLAQIFRLRAQSGLLVQRVERGSPAAVAGVRGGTARVVVAGESYTLGGDLIVGVDGQTVASRDDLRAALDAHSPGDRVRLELWRGDERRTLEIKLGRQPAG
jgi:S1-C subfamily serine protease